MSDPKTPEKIGEPAKIDTVNESCNGCGVVQEMDVYKQRYENNPPSTFTDNECPVCGEITNMPW